ncbi:MAG TPA: LPXTG cell wall anchor domain-containing protein [Candidatus Blautia excrementipullorum]|nr:LPXTG cell wall anchor domain-containing protein [Candidatus Blautia excrementipullorum]
MKASVVWDVENCSYDVSSTEAQNFRIRGAVSLPDGVDNNNQLTLAAYIQVSVNAYSPKKVSAEDNYISGIEYNGVYTTQSRISFTAVGAGMDNTAPRKGDTRYIPRNWTVINTNTWTAAPYTASFGMAQSGDYTLKVVFKLQQYNGNSWTDADGSDIKQVPFRISKAKVTAPGLDLTPAANRRNAVKTGDSTPILPFVIILVAAVVVIGGILVYRRRKK